MCLLAGDSTRSEMDPPATVSPPIGATTSSLGSSLNPPSPSRTPAQSRRSAGTVPGSSMTETTVSPSLGDSSLPQADLSERGLGIVSGSGVAALGSGVVTESAAPSTSSDHQHPITRLQQGISKPKQYTDGTVRWCMSSTISIDEPTSVDEAFGNKN